MIQKSIGRQFLKQLEKLQDGTLHVITPEEKKYSFQGLYDKKLEATISIYRWSVVASILAKGDIGFAESYRDGALASDNLANLLTIVLKNENAMDSYIYGKRLSNFSAQILYYFQANNLRGSKRNIQKHYDLGNDFYALWLDPTMTYSSAIFKKNTKSLKQAQHNKYDSIVDKLDISSGNLLEIGCGWGGFAERALAKKDFAIKGITISDQQYIFAKNRLKNKAQICLEDYRLQIGKYDGIVSIEMFEAVGEKFWLLYFEKIKSLLKSNGKAILQIICIADRYFEKYRKTADVMRTFIFPGGMLPSLSGFKETAKKAGLRVEKPFAFGQDYVKTLQHWLDSFEANIPKIKTMNFDEKFIRIWRIYLSLCIASFSVDRSDVMQVELSPTKN